MKIVKLEINGFKSFADKTVFAMHPGITCIVGPNGCGKSNVVDAFRWVLGEQSAKTLRGEKMEEIIFNGTAEVKAKGMAETVLSFTGSTNGNGNADNVVEVARRLYRSGESEYFINKTRCRLKDVREIFLDTGLEVKSYSILEQGRIAEILNTKPIERRFLIEEVAGVMKYKVRKSEAVAKIERSRANLDRVNDIVSEVKRSINSLDRQVKKAEKFKTLTTELSLIELKIAKRDYAVHMETYTRLIAETDAISAELKETASTVSEKETAREAASRVIEEKQKALDTLSQSQRELDRDISLLEKDIALKRSSVDNISGHTERLNTQISAYRTEIEEASARVTELTRVEADLDNQCKTLDDAIETEKNKLVQTEESLDGVEEELREKNRALFKISDEISTLRNDAAKIQSTIGSVRQKKDSAASFFRHATSEQDRHEKEIKNAERTIVERQESIESNKEKKGTLTSEAEALQKEIDSMRAEITSVRETLAGDTSRLKSLEEVTSAELDVKEFTQNIDVMTLMSNIIEVPHKYETAVEAALGKMIKGFIVRDLEALKKGVKFLKEQAMERTSLMINIGNEAAKEDTDLGCHTDGGVNAFEVVKTTPEYRETIRSILGRFVIVDDIQRALYEISKGCSCHFATLDGDTVEPSGVVTSGKSGAILQYLRHIRALKEKTAASSIELNSIQERLSAALQRRDSLKKDQTNIDHIVSAMDKELSIIKLNLKKHIEDRDRLTQKLHYMKIESEQTDKEIETLNDKLRQRQQQEGLVQTRKEEINTYIEELRDTVTDKKVHLETLRASFTEKKAAITGMRERLKATRTEKSSHSKKIETLELKISDSDKESAGLKAKQEVIFGEIQLEDNKLVKLTERADDLKTKILAQKTEIELDIKIIHEIEAVLGQMRQNYEQTRQHLTDRELLMTESRLRIENIKGIIATNYGKDIDELEAPPLMAGEEEKTTVLRRKIAEIGPVNLASIEEYEALSTRYDFLSTQQRDLLTSIAELEEAISKINSTTRQKLTDGFNMLNLKFDETFKKFFGGGRAELVLTETTNILECGIDIVVQPPQKKLQNINLLSGGEKTLSAISLVFAGFLIKPTPMCILDEADAALDDSNTVRFTTMLKELSDKTQFIVITHNRVTMEAADYIYGITNEIPGISKVISMELTVDVPAD